MCAVIKNPLQRDGTSQRERLLKALLPANAPIDGRKMEDILSFAAAYSKEINFYNLENKIEGDWSCFYENDPCILLAILATTDTDSLEAAFLKIVDQINAYLHEQACEPADACEVDPLPGYYDAIINLIYGLAIRIQQACKRLPAGHVLKEEIIELIQKDVHLAIIDNKQQDALIQLIGFDKASLEPMNDYGPFIQTPQNIACACTKAWQLDREGFDCIYPDNSFNLDSLKTLFYIFFVVLLRIKKTAKAHFDECIAKNDAHQPHVTLFLTFVYLFQYAIDQLNTLTKAHLLYYYEQVLCLHKKREVPDKVHVIFEIAKNFHTHLVEEGTLLNAGKDEKGKAMVYALMEEVVVNKAKVEEIKTVYVNEKNGVVYAAPKADAKDGIAEEFKNDEQVHWKSLGSNENSLDEVGFALASPMFFLKEGLRAGMISYQLKKTVDGLPEAEYVQMIGKAKSFRFYYSSDKEWVEIENVYDAIERIIVKYPLLKELYEKNAEKLSGFFDQGFEAIKNLYEKLYSLNQTETTPSPAEVPKSKNAKSKKQEKEFGFQAFTEWIGKTDANVVADFLMEFSALADDGKKAAKKPAAAPLDPAAYRAALIQEVLQARNDVLALKHVFINRVDVKRKELDFFFIANTTALPFSPLVVDEKKPDIQSQWPIIKTLVKNTLNSSKEVSSTYNSIKQLQITGVDLKVAAYGMKDIVVQNDTSILDNSKEILPFTSRPYKGSYFYIGSKEVFQKKLDFVGVQMEWANKPASFATHYANYISSVNENSFSAKVELLNGGIYQDVYGANSQNLFNTEFDQKAILYLGAIKKNGEDKGDSIGIAASLRSVKVDNLSILRGGFELRSFGRDPYINDFKDYNVNVNRGFMRLSLSQQDFLHDEYQKALLKAVVGKTTALTDAQLVNEPYTPKLKNTSLFYVSTERTPFGINQANAKIEQFFHVTPFGYQKMEIDQHSEVFLLPQFNNSSIALFTQGNLYIGLKDAEPEQKVNMLFQVLEGTGDNRYAAPDVEWSYLVNNEWHAFKPFEIQDHTRADESSRKSLLKSGIIEFGLPKAISSDKTTILNNKLLWIRAVAHEDALPAQVDSDAMIGIQRIAALPDLTAITAQAGIAAFENHDNGLAHLETALPAKTITKFVDSRAGIKKLDQPYYSFEGRMPENDLQFYTRVSERLRHKNRAICIWDYEHMVLQAFPDLHKVKCINHTGITQNILLPYALQLAELAPGFVTISVIPDLRNKNAINKIEPRVPVGMLDEIKLFLKKHTNLFVANQFKVNDKQMDYLQVLNPLYEQLKVKTCVRFYDGLDVAYYKYVLNEDLKKFLSPWAFDANKEINFGSTYHKSAILNFIEERKYVDVVLGFEVMHFKDGQLLPDYDADRIMPSTSRSILTSYNQIDVGKEYEHEIVKKEYKENDPCPTCEMLEPKGGIAQPVD